MLLSGDHLFAIMKVHSFKIMLQNIDRVTKALLLHGMTLAGALGLLDHLVGEVAVVNEPEHATPMTTPWARRCKPANKENINSDSPNKLACKHFHNAVIKIQNKKLHLLTVEETAAAAVPL